jgi:hypothetical protein
MTTDGLYSSSTRVYILLGASPKRIFKFRPELRCQKEKEKRERERTTDTRQKTRLNFGEEAVTAEAHDFVGHVRSITGRWQNNNQEIVGSSSSHTQLEIF